VRSRAKIEAAIKGAKLWLDIEAKEPGGFSHLIWKHVDGRPQINRFKSITDVPAKTPMSEDLARELKRRGFTTAILSNGTPQMLESLVGRARLTDAFDAILSVDAVGVFKTHPRVYRYALDALGLPARAIAFMSSNGWDAYAASDFGMRVVWCNRYGQPR